MTLYSRAKNAFLYASRSLGLFRLARRLTRTRLRILCYHGFSLRDEEVFRKQLFMTGETFRRRLHHLRSGGYPVLELGDALRRLDEGTLPSCATVLTIDDGFYDVLAVAAPILEEHGFPATLYVSTYYCLKGHPVFRLVVQYMFYRSPLPALDLDGLAPGLAGKTPVADGSESMWNLIRAGEETMDEDGRMALLAELGRRLEVDFEEIRKSRILDLLRPDEVKGIFARGVDVQLHTHRHRLPSEREGAMREILQNREALAPLARGPLVHFCYPSGIWSKRHFAPLSEAGVVSATTCEPGFNARETPKLALRRFLDGESTPQIVFEAEMSGFLELLRSCKRRRGSRPAHGETSTLAGA